MCLLLLFSGLVGPGWVRCGTSFRSAGLSFLASGVLKARLSRRVGVVRVLGSFGQGGATRRHRRVPGMPDESDGDFDEYGGAASSDIASAGWALACVQHQAGRVGGGLQAELDRDTEVGIGGQHNA
jgi:hypothetical protein